jgi:phenylpropionate dioxygenase-like ring-hydroxylating dioxygenase large terminal subunit
VAGSLVARDYFDGDVWDREVADVLRSSWLPVCRADQIANPGDRFALTLLGTPVVAVRGTDGVVRVFGNVCQHRAATIVDEGPGHDSALVCPYHRWSYRLDGTVIGGPLADGVELDGTCLPAVRHTIWHGFVLVNLDGHAPEPHDELVGLDLHLAPWRWDELVTVGSIEFESTWNWKVMVENWIECYHHLGTHRETVELFQPARNTRLLDSDGAWTAMTVDSIAETVSEAELWMPGVDDASAPLLSIWAAYPLLLGGSMSNYAFWLQVVPDGATHHRVTWYLLAHQDQIDSFTTERIDAIIDQLAHIHREDMDICARVQAGMESGLFDHPMLTRLEQPVAEFQAWVRARLDLSPSS